MTDSSLEKTLKGQVSKDFRSSVTGLENTLRQIADGENVIVGSKDRPIVRDHHALPIKHFFMEGVYVREMRMSRDMAVVGAIHKTKHMCFLLSGHLTVASESGTVDYIAPCYVISTPGVKRVLYANEDSVWYNTHENPSNTEDISKLEEDLVALSYEEYNEHIKSK
tara:strand:+ start:12503 stop:13000 length:498 start_codon:yes stop_codon:yes gene_type:complete